MSGWPEKPYVIAAILAWLSEQAPVIFAATLAFFMAALRIIYGGGSRRRALLEGAICGGLTITMISGMDYFGLPLAMAGFVGGWIGFLGVEKVRDLAERFVGYKLPRRNGD